MNNKKLIKRIYNVVIVLLLIGAIAYVVTRFVHPANTEYTDDAQVQRHITPINTRVQGFIKEIRFEEYQHVKKGDTLVIIEDAEYRLLTFGLFCHISRNEHHDEQRESGFCRHRGG